ncbi:hypothetical protein Acsp06_62830 [Actinomycetospora sp. NBRC 106375]|uniref:hypothetical protein n=1 Tax=Actinomycetospora sp. NBRC 106375 TaxID=3032207 RepID=UPI0024A53F1C|nr:hypothetical protein [Actinomycetospora sp. NBRC 106375]GLZ50098.1 hypothetical protein Acsp06_62830 [Actinomycetospora sp. NBRC 106375]
MPGTIIAAQVLVLLSGLGGLLWGAFSVVGGIFAIFLSGSDGGAGTALVLIGLLIIVLAVVELRCCARLGRADPSARGVLAGVYAINLLATVALGAVDGLEGLGLLLAAVAWTLLVLGLLWLPESSRAAFSDTPRTSAPVPPHGSAPAGSGPVISAHPLTAPPSTGDRWADEQTASVAAFCGQCGRRNSPPRQHCGHCGSRQSTRTR